MLLLPFGGNVSIGGTLTYEDVENIDSVSLCCYRSGVELGASGVGGTFSATGFGSLEGGLNVSGVVTATSFAGDGSSLTGIEAASFLFNTGVSSSLTLALLELELQHLHYHQLQENNISFIQSLHQMLQQETLKLILLVHLISMVVKEVILLNKFQSQLACQLRCSNNLKF